MDKIEVNVVLTTQPVFLPFFGCNKVAVLAKGQNENGIYTFCCVEQSTLHFDEPEKMLASSTIADILLSSVGDSVAFFVKPDKYGNPSAKVLGFINISKKFGKNFYNKINENFML
jgi:hypothetical protein